jgi:hypothetical protein
LLAGVKLSIHNFGIWQIDVRQNEAAFESDVNLISIFSLQLAMTLARQEETQVEEWEEFQRAHLGDTTGLSE